MNILIISGGSSSERKISLISADSVRKALLKNGHAVKLFDFKKGIGELQKLIPTFDIIFPVMHGKEGEDGTLYKLLRESKRPYVGSDSKGAQIAFDKILFKKYCDKNKIPTAEWKIIKNERDVSNFGFPCVLKATFGGSSHEVALLNSEKNLSSNRVKKILQLNNKFYVEKLLKGPEITVGVLLGKALPVIEIVPPNNQWFDYKNKYSGDTKEIPFAPSVNLALQKRVQKIALQLHTAFNLGSFSRTDIIIENETPYVLEINTPGGVGLTSESLLPKAAKAAGISFNQLVEKMLAGAK